MDRHAEAALDGVPDAFRGGGCVLGAPALHEVQNVVGALVGALRAARPGQEPGDASGGERREGRVEGLSARPERRGHVGDGPAVDAMAAQHLVLHLHAIAPIEELVPKEGLVLDGVGVGMQRPRRPQRRGLRVLGREPSPGHMSLLIMYTKASVSRTFDR